MIPSLLRLRGACKGAQAGGSFLQNTKPCESYFDIIVNHRGFDVPGYDANTSTNLYPGMVSGDFHPMTTPDGFFRNVSNIRDYGNQWEVQNLSLSGLLDIAHENPNANFGPTKRSTDYQVFAALSLG